MPVVTPRDENVKGKCRCHSTKERPPPTASARHVRHWDHHVTIHSTMMRKSIQSEMRARTSTPWTRTRMPPPEKKALHRPEHRMLLRLQRRSHRTQSLSCDDQCGTPSSYRSCISLAVSAERTKASQQQQNRLVQWLQTAQSMMPARWLQNVCWELTKCDQLAAKQEPMCTIGPSLPIGSPAATENMTPIALTRRVFNRTARAAEA